MRNGNSSSQYLRSESSVTLLLLFGLAHNNARIAGHEFLQCTVHEEVQFFKNDGANKCRAAFRLDNCREGAIATEKLNVNFLDQITRRGFVVCVPNSNLAAGLQPELLDDAPMQD